MVWGLLLLALSSATGRQLALRDARLGDGAVAELNRFVDDEVRKAGNRITALSAAAVKDGRVVWTRATGFSDFNLSVPATESTRFMWASVSKTIIAHAVMLLVDRGLVALDGDVSEHLGFPVRHPKYRKWPITYRMLLTHTSSINDAWEYFLEYETCGVGDGVASLGDWLRGYLVEGGAYYHRPDKMRGSWFRKRPGSQYAYSNEGSSLAAYGVEKTAQAFGLLAAGETFNEFVHRYIFGPLGIYRGSASYMVSELASSGPADLQRPAAYYPGLPDLRPLEEYFVYGWPEYPCTRWLASPAHQAALLANFMQNGTSPGLPQLLSPQAVAEMRRSQLDEHTVTGSMQQGLIWYYTHQGGRTLLGHDGCDFGTSTAAFFNPDTNVGFVIASSSDCQDHQAIRPIENIQNKILDTFEEGGVAQPRGVERWDPHGAQRRERRRGVRGIWDWVAQRFTRPHLLPAPNIPCGPCWWLCTDANWL